MAVLTTLLILEMPLDLTQLLMVAHQIVDTKKSRGVAELDIRGANLKVSAIFIINFIVHMSQMSKSINVMGGR